MINAVPAVCAQIKCPVNELVLVDDDDLTIDIVSWIIGKGNHQSRLFTEAETALEYLKVNTPRLLIVDFYMPGMTGLDFISSLHDSSDLGQTQVYLCSAVVPPRGTEELFKAMNVGILDKQLICDRSRLTELLDTCLIAE